MSDYVTMQRRIWRELDRNDITSVAQDAIQSAVRFYGGQRMWFNEQRWTASTSTSVEYYSLPNEFREVDTINITVNTNQYPLRRRSWAEIDEAAQPANLYSGYPTEYAIQRNELRLYPIPNAQFTLVLSGQSDLTELSSDAATNAWMVHGEELIRSRACADILETYTQDYDNPRIAVYRNREQENFLRLRMESNKRLATGKVRKRRW